jgi:hypothetical protein
MLDMELKAEGEVQIDNKKFHRRSFTILIHMDNRDINITSVPIIDVNIKIKLKFPFLVQLMSILIPIICFRRFLVAKCILAHTEDVQLFK